MQAVVIEPSADLVTAWSPNSPSPGLERRLRDAGIDIFYFGEGSARIVFGHKDGPEIATRIFTDCCKSGVWKLCHLCTDGLLHYSSSGLLSSIISRRIAFCLYRVASPLPSCVVLHSCAGQMPCAKSVWKLCLSTRHVLMSAVVKALLISSFITVTV